MIEIKWNKMQLLDERYDGKWQLKNVKWVEAGINAINWSKILIILSGDKVRFNQLAEETKQ